MTKAEAERALLGAMLLSASSLNSAFDVVCPEELEDTHATIFRAMGRLRMMGERVEFAALEEELRRSGVLNKVGGSAYLLSLINACPTSLAADVFIKAMRCDAGHEVAEPQVAPLNVQGGEFSFPAKHNVLSGPPRSGKTLSMLTVAAELSWYGPVLYVSGTENLEALRAKLQTITGNRFEPPLLTLTAPPFSGETVTYWLDTWLSERPGARLIVLDGLGDREPTPQEVTQLRCAYRVGFISVRTEQEDTCKEY